MGGNRRPRECIVFLQQSVPDFLCFTRGVPYRVCRRHIPQFRIGEKKCGDARKLTRERLSRKFRAFVSMCARILFTALSKWHSPVAV